MYAKASSDDTAKQKTCIHNATNAKPTPKKLHRKRKNKSPKDALECKKQQTKCEKINHICPLNKCKKQCTTNATKVHQKGTKHATKMHKTGKTHAINKQNKCDQKRSGLCLCICLLCICFLFATFSDLLCVSLRKHKKNEKHDKTQAKTTYKKCKQKNAMQKHRTQNAQTSKKITQKRWCVKFGCACAFFVRFVRFCSAFFKLLFCVFFFGFFWLPFAFFCCLVLSVMAAFLLGLHAAATFLPGFSVVATACLAFSVALSQAYVCQIN